MPPIQRPNAAGTGTPPTKMEESLSAAAESAELDDGPEFPDGGGDSDDTGTDGSTADGEHLPASTLQEMWVEARRLYRAWQIAQDTDGSEVDQKAGRQRATRYVTAGRHFIDWAIAHGHAPDSLPHDSVPLFKVWAADPERGIGKPSLHIAALVGQHLVDQDYLDDPRRNQRAGGTNVSVEDQPDQQQQVQQVQPPAPAQQATVRVEVAGPRQQQRAQRQQSDDGFGPQRGQRRDLFAQAAGGPAQFQKARIYKRGRSGKPIMIDDYSMSEIGSNFQRFLKTRVDPDHSDPTGTTTYEIYKLDAEGNEVGVPLDITIEGQPMPQGPENPLDRAHQVMELIDALKSKAKDGGTEDDLMQIAKQRAAAGGSINEMMFMMMMSKMMQSGGGDEADKVIKVLEKLKPPGMDNHSLQPMPLPQFPPALPPPSELAPVVAKLLELQLAPKPLPPPPPAPPTTLDMLKEIGLMKDIFAPRQDPEVGALRAELGGLKDMIKDMAQRPQTQPGGLDDALKVFTKVKELAAAITPTGSGGGLTQLVQSFFTPAMVSTLSNAFVMTINKIKQQPQTVAQVPTQPGAPQSPPIPPGAVPFMEALKAAKEEPEQIAAVLNILHVHWLDAAWQPILMPYMQAIAEGNVDKTKEPVLDILRNVRPDLAAKPEFVGRCVNMIISSVRETMQGQQSQQAQTAAQTPVALAPASTSTPAQATVVQFPKQPERAG